MTFDDVLKLAEEYKARVERILPRANWVMLHGRFTPEMLRGIADEVERRYGSSSRPQE